ncbi:MAG TPA: alanine racemase [Anaeromyxobacteraceae bacterium]
MPIRPTEAVVDLSAIASNYRLAVEIAGRPAIGIVKADAYGHGAVPVARTLCEAGAPLLAVALVEEGLELREAGIDRPVLVLGAAYGDRYDLLVRHRLTPLVFTPEHVRGLAAAARASGVRARAHLKVDTGMGRIGVTPAELPALLEALRAAPEVELEGVCTHFASADLEPRTTTERQVALFAEVSEALARAGMPPRYHHLANSAGTLDFPGARQDLTRPGIMLYGYLPFDPATQISDVARGAARRLEPALTWRTAITHVKTVAAGTAISYGGRWVAERTSRIATLPVGYADGYDRRLSGRPGFGRADVLVRGRRAPVAGTICMDMCMADVTDVPGAAVGDEVVLLGAQGGARIDADELAGKVGTISYEILCGVGRRVPRAYI